jgi:2-iminobutanoate/2-iminopropanoate deaminase
MPRRYLWFHKEGGHMPRSLKLGHAESHPAPGREVVSAAAAPKAIGPYSQGITAGDFVFTAGEAGVDPGTGKLVEGGIAAQTRKALQNIQAILEAAGSSLQRVVRCGVFLADIADFQAMNAVYAEFFPADKGPPARTTVQAGKLPMGALVEIDAVALLV